MRQNSSDYKRVKLIPKKRKLQAQNIKTQVLNERHSKKWFNKVKSKERQRHVKQLINKLCWCRTKGWEFKAKNWNKAKVALYGDKRYYPPAETMMITYMELQILWVGQNNGSPKDVRVQFLKLVNMWPWLRETINEFPWKDFEMGRLSWIIHMDPMLSPGASHVKRGREWCQRMRYDDGS